MKSRRLLAVLLAGALAAMAPQTAMAAGTAACTNIANTALVDFNVGTVAQPQASGVANPFMVGNKVRLDVVTSDASPGVTVLQGATNGVLTFTVTNTGNKVQDYALSTVNVATNGTAFPAPGTVTDDFDAGAATAYVESGGNVGYQAAEDIATYIDGLDPDQTAVVYVIVAGPVPATANDGSNALYGLVATSHKGEVDGELGQATTEGDANGSCGEDTVFADLAASTGPDDGDEDGKDSDRSGLVVSASANLTVTKTSAVYSDPINGTTSPKAIPGAVVTYTIGITNPGGSTATATSISVSDTLDGNLEFVTLYDDGTPCAAGEGILVDGSCKTNSNGDADDADFTGGAVHVTGLSLAPGASAEIKFQVTIK